MATSDTEICNRALARLGSKAKIANIDEKSNEAVHCKLFFDVLKKLILAKDAFGFSTKYRAPSDLGNPPSHYAYQYTWPSDCLHILELNPGQSTKPEYEIANVDDTVSILTQEEITTVKYSIDRSVAVFPVLVEEYLTAFLSNRLVMPLTKNFKLFNDTLNELYAARLSALAVNANQQHKVIDEAPDWIKNR